MGKADLVATLDTLERAVAAGLANGLSFDEIAVTVGRHRSALSRACASARQKVGARTIPHLAAIAARAGL